MAESHYECSICLSDFTLAKMMAFHCGHTFCVDCINSYFDKRKKKCPSCREVVVRGEQHTVYLVPYTPVTIVEGLQMMDHHVKPVTVRNAARKIGQAVSELDHDSPGVTEILKAVSEFKERFIPVLEENKALREKIADIEGLHASVMAVATSGLEAARSEAESRASKAEALTNRTLLTAEETFAQLRNAQVDERASRREAEKWQAAAKEVEGTHESLKLERNNLQRELASVKERLSQRENAIGILKDEKYRQRQKMRDRIAALEMQVALQIQLSVNTENLSDISVGDREPRKRRKVETEAQYTPLTPPEEEEPNFFEGLPPVSFSSTQIPETNVGAKKDKAKARKPFQPANGSAALFATGPRHTIRIPKGP